MAIKRLATVRWHQEQAASYRASAARMSDEVPEARRRFLRAALRHEARAVERRGAVTRAVRQVALRLLPTWAGDDPQQLLDVAAAIAEASTAAARRRRCRPAVSRFWHARPPTGPGVVTTPEEVPAPDRRAQYAASFFDGVRYSCAHHEHYGWSRAEAERVLGMCDRIERFGLRAAWLVVKLCCGGREPLRFEDAVATVEAICQPAELTEPSW